MLRLIATIKGGRRGIVAILISVCLVGLLGITAIAIDGGLLQDNRRRVQAACDAAALDAAAKLYANYPAIVTSNFTNADPGGQAYAAAFASASANGYSNDGVNSTVTVHLPPQSGPFATKAGYVEVLITYNQRRYFSSIFGSTRLPVHARSVARGRWVATGNGIIVLDPILQSALDASGTGSLTVTGGASVIVNSSDPASAARATGGGALTASLFNITGGANGTFNGEVVTGTTPIPDPLRYLPVPTGLPDGTITEHPLAKGNRQYVLTAGRHTNLPSFQVGDEVIFKQASAGNGGIYFIDGGGFSSQGATITMDSTTSGGIMIYNNPNGSANSQGINITGNEAGLVNLSALTSGPYAGILFWQNRTATQTMSVAGNGSFSLTGTFYTANALLAVSGNGTATIGSQYISRTLNITGGGATTINYSENGTAKLRDIRLVE